MIPVALVAARFVHFVGMMIAFGAFAYAGSLPRTGEAGTGVQGLALGASAAIAVGALTIFVATVVGLGDGVGALTDRALWATVLGATDFGRVWIVHAAFAMVLLAIALRRRARPSLMLDRLGIIVCGGLLATTAATGHAQMENGLAELVHRAADTIHSVAAAVWIGALPVFLVLLRHARDTEDGSDVAARLARFHGTGTAAVLLLAISGLVNAWFLVGGVGALFTTGYGQLLLAKLLLFAFMLALAADNRLRLVPALAAGVANGKAAAASAALAARIRLELILGILVLGTVAVLGTLEPATSA